jgi:hypothetical protein
MSYVSWTSDRLGDDVADGSQLLRAGQVDVSSNERRIADRSELAHNVYAYVFRIDPHEHVF